MQVCVMKYKNGSPRWKKKKPLLAVRLEFGCSMKMSTGMVGCEYACMKSARRVAFFSSKFQASRQRWLAHKIRGIEQPNSNLTARSGFFFFHRGPPFEELVAVARCHNMTAIRRDKSRKESQQVRVARVRCTLPNAYCDMLSICLTMLVNALRPPNWIG